MKHIKLAVLLYVFSCLTGCAVQPKYDKLDVHKTEYRTYTVPDTLLEPCIPEKPMVSDEYLKLLPNEREDVLTRYSVSLLITISKCNVNLKEIKKLQSDNK